MLISFLWDHLNFAISHLYPHEFWGWGDCGRSPLAAGSPGTTGVSIWSPQSLDKAHRDLTAGRGLFCSKAAGAWRDPLEHHVCPGNGEEPPKMCSGDMTKKPARRGAIFQFFSFFVTSRDDLESVTGWCGTSFIYCFSVPVYYICKHLGPGREPHCA